MADAAAAAEAAYLGAEVDNMLIRHMRPDELKQAMDIWKEQGLEESENNVSTFYQVDPEGFFVTVDTRTGQVVATCACVRQHESLFFVGMYAVRKHLQGRGIGTRLWRTMARRMGDCNAGLNAVPKTPQHVQGPRGIRSRRHVEHLARPSEQLRAVPIDADLLPQVIAYDALVHCYNREKAVTYTVYDPDGFARAVVRRRREDGREVVCGFGKIGTNILGGAMMGPVYAADREAGRHGNPLTRVSLTMMVVDCNPDAVQLAELMGLESHMHVPRCYRKAIVPARFEQIFAQHDLNFSAF
ncbi:hypothetical protein HPB48_013389 [Haemaphysalis longicornis]|uniref:N-acetyltransferase domain-containing protein n=1 Tax=Haemaphysalis longicornis TaxID=44386 RepID=A0A9J6G6R5_HAELO|nr:hypothetical protein HPB48_013389 [Haemaphysalis longicornis]